jgi:hypothetical protein
MKWISVKDRIPGEEVIALGYQNQMIIGYIDVNPYGLVIASNDNESLYQVTHWMPLPEPPDDKIEE